jgi:hypothetical protein
MNKIFIVDKYKNPGLLKFIQTKLFFDAKNQSVAWAYDCEVVDDISSITETVGIVINSNQFVTTNFRKKYAKVDSLVDARSDPDLIEFDVDYNYVMSQRPPFEPGSKQLYILENLYKIVLKSKKLVYLDNTEPATTVTTKSTHFYGLASGWKSVRLVRDSGFDQFESITIYDKCQRQLDFQKFLHSHKQLPDQVDIDPPFYGEYNPPADIREIWQTWHNTKVNFELLDLFQTPVFPDNSLVWVSNVFHYEPTLFEYGWEKCKDAKHRLITQNKSCTIIF